MMARTPLLVTGSTGKIGRLLRVIWSGAPIGGLLPLWQTRKPPETGDDLLWDILQDPAPSLAPGAILLHLAGSTTRDPAILAEHGALAVAIARAAERMGVRHILHASSAAIYGLSGEDHLESERPAPTSPYGNAKAEAELAVQGSVPVTLLRIGNIAGADAILGGPPRAITLDPVPGQPDGPERSYIGPTQLADVLARLARRAATGQPLPPVLNIAQPQPVGMAALLTAAGRAWSWGSPNPAVIPRVGLQTDALTSLVPDLPPATAKGLVADLSSLQGLWP